MDQTHPAPPSFAALAADPEIAPLLDFTPARRKIERPDGWTPALQRELIARIAFTGSPGDACDAMDKNLSGAKHLYRSDGADSFRQAWKAAMALGAARKRRLREATPRCSDDVPGIVSRKARQSGEGPLPGQVRNERGEWEDEASLRRRGAEAGESIAAKLLRIRRLYLQEISACPGKRAAFEILTELPIDWDKAAELEPQPDEPYNIANQRQPDMILTAESGWMAGDLGYGADRKAEARAEIDRYREEQGLEPVQWGEDAPPSSPTPIGDPPVSCAPAERPGPRVRAV